MFKTDLFAVVKIKPLLPLSGTELQMSSQYSCRYTHVLRKYKYWVTKNWDTHRNPLTAGSRFLLGTLVVPQLFKKFPRVS